MPPPRPTPCTDQSTDLSTTLVTDRAATSTPAPAPTQTPTSALMPAVNDPYQGSIHAAAQRLTTLARTAGLHLVVGSPHGDADAGERLPLNSIGEASTRELATYLAGGEEPGSAPAVPGVDGAAADLRTAERAVDEQEPVADGAESGNDGVAADLRAAARAAGIDLAVGTARIGPGGWEWLPLGEVDCATASALADRIESSLEGLLRCAHQLREAGRAAGVETRARAVGGDVDLGDLEVAEGLALLHALTPDAERRDIDPDDQHAGDTLADSLTTTIRRLSGSPSFEALYAGYCRRCRCEPTLLPSSLKPEHASALTSHLIGGAA